VITRCRSLRVLGVFALALASSCSAGTAPVVSCHGGWRVQTGQVGVRESDGLLGVSAASARDVWAVGFALPPSGPARTLVERWQGGPWQRVPSPDWPSGGSYLNAVAALSGSNAWAVGLSRPQRGPARTLILHWDGRRWAIAASPNAGPGDNALVSIAAASAKDIWAVGYRGAGVGYRSLVEHWDGTSWTVVRLPRLGGPGDGLNAVDAAAAGVVWAVGGSARSRGPSQPLIFRLDGRNWSAVRVPPSLRSATLSGVAAWSRTGAWVVGATRGGAGDRAFSLEAAGTKWRVIPLDLPIALSVDLNGMWAAAQDDVWAVGSSFDGRWYRLLVEHGVDGRWSRVPAPRIVGDDSRLMAVAGLGRAVWAVGSTARSGGPQRTLILQRCASSPS
jgi:hypothetical protein